MKNSLGHGAKPEDRAIIVDAGEQASDATFLLNLAGILGKKAPLDICNHRVGGSSAQESKNLLILEITVNEALTIMVPENAQHTVISVMSTKWT